MTPDTDVYVPYAEAAHWRRRFAVSLALNLLLLILCGLLAAGAGR